MPQGLVDDLLTGLNPPQREAVTHPEGPLLVLAGAGSGKTRVLTHRIAWLVHTERARVGEILAITFTNKAAQEMRERVELLLGHSTRSMWVMTFHAACARILRAEAPRLGYTRQYTIYDAADSRRLVKRCLDDLDIDTKRFTPGAMQSQISAAKSRLRDVETYQQMVGDYFEKTVGEVYELYERELHRMNAMDFDDLLVRTVNVLELFPEVRARYSAAFRHVLVDEYQDTNAVQYRLLQLLAGEHRNLMVVGDDAQCLVEGTAITMGDGSLKAIEDVREGDEVLSGHGSGDYRPARVTAAFRTDGRTAGIRIRTRGGLEVVSTPEHVHFAGYRVGLTPDLHATYLMWRRDKGCRVGTTRTYTRGQRQPVMGFSLRANHEKADAAWVVSTHDSEPAARQAEAIYSLRYGVPTLPFVARRSGSVNTLVGEQERIDAVFAAVDSEAGGAALLEDEGLGRYQPHHQPSSFDGRRRVLNVTLCGSQRGAVPLHRIALAGRDEATRETLEELGLSVRPAKGGGWRFETAHKDAGRLLDIVDRISAAVDVSVRCVARLGRDARRELPGFSLPFTTASNVRPGMIVFTGDGGWDVVESVERVELDRPVYDLNVEGTHNFVANGIVTHNSIYSFRGADVTNILSFEDTFEDAHTVKLEQNYRSTQTVLDAANAVISHNRGQRPKTLWTDLGEGDPIKVRALDDEHAEARYIVGEIERMVDEGVSLSEIACFYRTNAQSRVLEDTLVRREISYQVVGGTKFYERAVVKDVLAYLMVLANPQDVIAFQRCANAPKRGIGQTSMSRLLAHAETMGVTVWEAASDAGSVAGLGTAAVKSFGRFMDVMEGLRARAEEKVPIGDLLEALMHESGYIDALEAERTFEAEGNLELLEQLVEVGREFDARAQPEEDTLDVFLQQIALVADADTRRDDEGMCTLMSLHNAKGLEYPTVFILGMEEGIFPHSRALDEGGLEEERRLCYVGITRAMRDLTLTYARRRNVFGATAPGLPSRFLQELPSDVLDEDSRPEPRGSTLGRVTSWAGAATSAAERQPVADAGSFRLGDDVGHPAFGEGVVTAVEAGGIVVIRFAKDGSERKLMAAYAPLTRR